MSTRILHDTSDRKACLYDSVTDTAFGPIFGGDGFDDAEQEAEAFCKWLEFSPVVTPIKRSFNSFRRTSDPRAFSDDQLTARYREFRREVDAGKVTA